MPKNDEEHRIQCAFVSVARMWMPKEVVLYAVCNESYGGTKKDMLRGKKFKAEGRLPGVPDIFIAWPRLGFHGLYIEFKKSKGGSLSVNQREVIEKLRVKGYCVAVCRCAADAMELLKRYALGSHEDNVMNDHNWK